MRQLLILMLSLTLVAACNNDKGKNRRDDRRSEREQDDYRSRDEEKDRDTRDADYSDRDTDTDMDSGGSGWSSSEKDVFVSNCVREATKSGSLSETQGTNYCECMQRKLEILYPNAAEVGNIDMESERMKQMVADCIKKM
jgi:hypothetical protein